MKKYTIENNFQKLTLLNYGATIYTWKAFSDQRNIVITNEDLNDYPRNDTGFLSSTIGRVANRINRGKFILNNKTYNLEINFLNSHGHGGSNGFHTKEFEVIEHSKTKIIFKYKSPHLESNYPGEVDVFVTYELVENEMILTFNAYAYDDTIINLTNHAYFNLSNKNNILNHKIRASTYEILETDESFIPTGKILNYEDGIYDLSREKSLEEVVLDDESIDKADGLDHFFIFGDKNEVELKYKNKSLKITTTYPGFQIYTMQKEITQPLLKRKYEKYLGVAIECQFEPDAINHNNFSSIILRKNEKYEETIKYKLNEV